MPSTTASSSATARIRWPYSAAALSYLIQNADKPIILTGAQQPISNEITDAKKNLRDSVICAIDPGSRADGGVWRARHRGHPRQKEQDHQLRRLCVGQFPGAGAGAGRPAGAVCPLAVAHRPCGV